MRIAAKTSLRSGRVSRRESPALEATETKILYATFPLSRATGEARRPFDAGR
jgi:hypothetical protein